ncbi:MAG: LysR family transcriptional regulator [Planctomycetaceae bacterium]|nr:LysR family transcriptional regulator [Planctomycetaceae bacterium]
MAGNQPTIEQLRALAAFAETGGVRAAARLLRTSQSVVTRKLNAFRKSARNNAILLTDNGRSPELTDAGRAILPAIRDLVRQYDQLMDCLNGRADAAQRVRIAAGHFSSQFYLPDVFDKALCESVQVEVCVVRGRDRILGVADGRYDIGVLSHVAVDIAKSLQSVGKSVESIVIEPLQMPLMVVIAARKSPEGRDLQTLPREKSVTLSWLHQWELLGLDGDSGIRRNLERKAAPGERISFLTEGGGWTVAREFCRRGLGVAVLPLATLTSGDRKDFVIRRLSDKLNVRESVIFRRQPLSTGTQTVIDRLKDAVAKHHREVQCRWDQYLAEKC